MGQRRSVDELLRTAQSVQMPESIRGAIGARLESLPSPPPWHAGLPLKLMALAGVGGLAAIAMLRAELSPSLDEITPIPAEVLQHPPVVVPPSKTPAETRAAEPSHSIPVMAKRSGQSASRLRLNAISQEAQEINELERERVALAAALKLYGEGAFTQAKVLLEQDELRFESGLLRAERRRLLNHIELKMQETHDGNETE